MSLRLSLLALLAHYIQRALAKYIVIDSTCWQLHTNSWQGKEVLCGDLAAALRSKPLPADIEVVPVLSQSIELFVSTFADDVVMVIGLLSNFKAQDTYYLYYMSVKYPKVWFVSLDCLHHASAPNFICAQFRDDESAYAAGFLAGLVTVTKVVGVVGSYGWFVVPRLLVGFQAGVLASCSSCNFSGTILASSFSLPVGYTQDVGSKFGEWLVESQGADVVFGAGGHVASGAILGASSVGALSMGSESDEHELLRKKCVSTDDGATDIDETPCADYDKAPYWCESADDYVDDDFNATVMCCACNRSIAQEKNGTFPLLVTSAVRNYEAAVEYIVQLLLAGKIGGFIQGLTNGILTLGYRRGAVGLAPCHDACDGVTEAVWAEVRALEAKLASGTLELDPALMLGRLPYDVSLDKDQAAFSRLLVLSRAPPILKQQSFAIYRGSIDFTDRFAVFGGVSVNGTVLGEFWMYKESEHMWVDMNNPLVYGTPPALAQACLAPSRDSLILFGGRRDDAVLSSRVYVFHDLFFPEARYEWDTEVNFEQSAEPAVPAVEGHSCVSEDFECLLVFGGRGDHGELGDLARLCITGNVSTWKVLWKHSGDVDKSPGPRQGAGIGIFPAAVLGLSSAGSALLVAGGTAGGEALADVWVFELTAELLSDSWTRLPDLPHGTHDPVVFQTTIPPTANGSVDIIVVQMTSLVDGLGLLSFAWDKEASSWHNQSAAWNLDRRLQSELVHSGLKGIYVPPEGDTAGRTVFFGGGVPQDQLSAASFRFQFSCPRGHQPRGVSCDPCPRGQTSYGLGLDATCKSCIAGSVAAEPGSSACQVCPAGSYANPATTACLPCASGTSTSGYEGQMYCFPCSAGRFSKRSSTGCQQCPVGRYANGTGSDECRRCPGLFTTRYPSSEDAKACICPESTYLPLRPGAESTCLACPAGMECPLGSNEEAFLASASSEEAPPELGVSPALLPGYMTLLNEPFKVYACAETAQCVGGGPGGCALRRDPKSVACGECLQGSFAVDGEGDCRVCRGMAALLTALVASCFFALGAVVGLTITVNRDFAIMRFNVANLAGSVAIFVSTVQTLGVFSVMHVRWIPVMSSVLKVLSLSTFDIKMFRLTCLFSNPTLLQYVSVQFPIPVAFVIILITLALKRMRRPLMRVLPEFVNALGAVCQFVFLPTIVSCLKPFICYNHPYGGASMQSMPNIRCFEDELHTMMVGIGVISLCIVPVPYLALCCFGTLRYAAVVGDLSGGRDEAAQLLRAMRFLVVKYKMTRYYYGIILILKSLIICLVPVVIRGMGQWQVLSMFATLVSFLQVQQALSPWHMPFTNIMDGVVNSLLTVILMLAAMSTGYQTSMEWLGLVGVSGLFGALVMASLLVIRSAVRYFQVSPWFHFFITHHKADAGAQARLLKLLLDGKHKQVFIDSDDLRDLDKLFNIVACHVGQVVVYLTRDTLVRPWCVGEIVTAKQSKTKVVAVHTRSYVRASQECGADTFMSMTLETSIAPVLGKFSITLADVREVLQWIHEVVEVVHTDPVVPLLLSLQYLVAKLTRSKSLPVLPVLPVPVRSSHSAKKMQNADSQTSEVATSRTWLTVKSAKTWGLVDRDRTEDGHEFVPGKPGYIVISSDPEDDEACAAANVLVLKMQMVAVHNRQAAGVCALCDVKADYQEVSELLAHSMAIIVLFSENSLTNEVQLFAVIESMWQRSQPPRETAPTVVVVTTPSFRFPESQFFDESLPPSMYTHPSFGVKQVRAIFSLIAVPFAPHSSNEMIDAQAHSILSRIPVGFDASCAERRESLCGVGVAFHVPGVRTESDNSVGRAYTTAEAENFMSRNITAPPVGADGGNPRGSAMSDASELGRHVEMDRADAEMPSQLQHATV